MRHSKLGTLMALLVASAFTFALPVLSKAEQLSPETPAVPSRAVNRNAAALSPVTTMSTAGKETFTEDHPRLVLALSGGALKAVAEIGVLRSLEQHHIRIDGIIGTSMGATIGALYCAGVSVDRLEAMFVDDTIQKSMLRGALWSTITRPLAPLTYIFKGRPYAGITSGASYLKFLQENLPSSFEQLPIPFAAVVTNLTDGQTAVLAHGNLPSAVLASNCVPTLYRPVLINGDLYVDGGLKANLPANIAQNMGADMVVAVLVDKAIAAVPNQRFKSKKQLIMRVMDIMMASSDKMQTRASDILIYPDVDFVPLMTHDPDVLKRGIAAGQKAADSVAARITSELLAVAHAGTAPIAPKLGASVEVVGK